MPDFKNRLKELRLASELTQEEFGEKVGVSKSAISILTYSTIFRCGQCLLKRYFMWVLIYSILSINSHVIST